MTRAFRISGLMIGLLLLVAVLPGRALIFYGTGDPAHNTSAPTGNLANSGWENEVFGDIAGTLVGPRQVLSAVHLHITPGALVRTHGLVYSVITVSNVAGTDLSLLTVAGRFPAWAELYRGSSEVGKTVTMFGRGLLRGEPVFASGTSDLRGWKWGTTDFKARWGTNVVREALAAGQVSSGAMLMSTFDFDAGDDEVAVTGGDSGNGMFLRDTDGVWKLAGVAYSVEAQYNTGPTGDGFVASLFDRRGFFQPNNTGGWSTDPTSFLRPGSALFHTRVSRYISQVDALIAAAPAPTVDIPRLLSSTSASGPFTEHTAYAITPSTRRITAVIDNGGHQFFRTEGAANLELLSVSGTQAVFSF